VTLLGLQSRVLMEMKTGYIIDFEVLDKREIALKSLDMEKTALENILQRINNVLLSKLCPMHLQLMDIFNSPDVWD